MNISDLVFIVKPVSTNCNLSCLYCYHNWINNRSKKGIMSTRVLDRFFGEIVNLEQKRIEIIWHGGEPLLVGREFFIDILKRENKSNKNFVNLVQTNGTLINQEWIDIFKSGNFKVGVSIDGPKVLHDLYRTRESGRGTFDSVVKKIRLLKRSDIELGSISVVSQDSIKIGKDIFYFLYNLGLRKINLSPCLDPMYSYAVESRNFGRFLKDIFEEWIKLDDPEVKIVPLSSFMQVLIGGQPTVCYFKKDCSNFLSIDANGDIYVCGRTIGEEEKKIGNIMRDNLNTILKSDKYLFIKRNIKKISKECKSCRWLKVCNNGCPLHRDNNGRYVLCNAMKLILPRMEEIIEENI